MGGSNVQAPRKFHLVQPSFIDHKILMTLILGSWDRLVLSHAYAFCDYIASFNMKNSVRIFFLSSRFNPV